MNEILDEDLTPNRKQKVALPYYRWSHIGAAFVIIGALFRIMHWPWSSLMLLFGASIHIGVELGFFALLRGKSSRNNRRLLVAPFILFMIGRWHAGGIYLFVDFVPEWVALSGLILIIALVTYLLARRKLDAIKREGL